MSRRMGALLLFALAAGRVMAQDGAQPPRISPQSQQSIAGTILPCWILDGDTIPYVTIREVVVVRRRTFKSKRDYYSYQRTIRNLKKVYPLAMIARDTLQSMDSVYATLTTAMQRSQYVAQMNRRLRSAFETKIRGLTYSQGRLLIKLIDRETGRSSYDIIREFKGGVDAGFFQGIARLFGSNLKAKYDPRGKDAMLEELVILYEHGQL